MECGACAKNCPVNAITVDTGVGCATAVITGWLTGASRAVIVQAVRNAAEMGSDGYGQR
jgi:ferredoxin